MHSNDPSLRSHFRISVLNMEEFAKEVSGLADGNVAVKSRRLFIYHVNSNSQVNLLQGSVRGRGMRENQKTVPKVQVLILEPEMPLTPAFLLPGLTLMEE